MGCLLDGGGALGLAAARDAYEMGPVGLAATGAATAGAATVGAV